MKSLVEAGKMAHSTFIRYKGIVNNHLKPALGHRKLKDLCRAEVRRLYKEKGKALAPRSVDYIHVTLQKPEEDCQTEPQTSTGEAEEGDGTFDAVAMVRRVDTDGDLEEHVRPCPMKEAYIMTSGKLRAKGRMCSVVSRAAKEDPAGCGKPFVSYLGVEVAPPWMDDVSESPRFPEAIREAVDKAQHAGVIGKFTALFPDPAYSREGYVRTLYLHKPPGPFATYEKSEYVVPESEIVPLVEALTDGSDGLSRFERYEEDTSCGRDLLVCTHGSHDACCGKFGYPVYETLRHGYAGASEKQLRVWRTSHIGGHRFAPTLIDFPEGRYWGHLEPDALEKLVLRNGPVAELGRFYRGWAGLSGKFEQIAEREIFMREGWEWTRYLKSGRTLAPYENEDCADVRIEYATPDGDTGAYEATVETSGTVMTLFDSGSCPLQEVKQYRVSRLERVQLGRR